MDMIMETVNNLDPLVALTTGAVVTVIFAGMLFLSFLQYLLTAAGYCKMFGKAGVSGWKAFIPLYNDYEKFKLAWNPRMFFVYLALSLVLMVVCIVDTTAAYLFSLPVLIAAAVIFVKQELKMAKSFGKGVGTGLLLMFVPFIAAPVLGFGKAEFAAN